MSKTFALIVRAVVVLAASAPAGADALSGDAYLARLHAARAVCDGSDGVIAFEVSGDVKVWQRYDQAGFDSWKVETAKLPAAEKKLYKARKAMYDAVLDKAAELGLGDADASKESFNKAARAVENMEGLRAEERDAVAEVERLRGLGSKFMTSGGWKMSGPESSLGEAAALAMENGMRIEKSGGVLTIYAPGE